MPKPFVKWAGGKGSLAKDIVPLFPRDLSQRVYREPFVGGGAIFFHLMRHRPPKQAHLSDALKDLIGAYDTVKSKTGALVKQLRALEAEHGKDARTTFYAIRKRFNDPSEEDPVDRAAWLIYLNKTCFNGLFRTNSKGHFNVPIGRFEKPAILDEPRLRAASSALQKVKLKHASFEHLRKEAKSGDFIYFDPPYVPLSKTANFASYSNGADGAFGPDQQENLAELFEELDRRGCLLALSNHDTPEVRTLYEGFEIRGITASRSISAKTQDRKPVGEVLVRNSACVNASKKPTSNPAAKNLK